MLRNHAISADASLYGLGAVLQKLVNGNLIGTHKGKNKTIKQVVKKKIRI